MSRIRKKWDRLTPRQQRLLQETGLVLKPIAEQVRERWQERLQELEAVFNRQGHLHRLNATLRNFVDRLRHRYQTGKLDPEVQKRCDQMGLKWFKRTDRDLWTRFYARAAAYVEQAGPAIPPVWKWPDRELSNWVGNQTGHWAQLSDERKQLLQRLQIKTQEEQQQALWDRRYAQAMAVHARLGPYRKRVYQDEDDSLKGWLCRQGHNWDQLSEGRRERLTAIGLSKRVPQQRKRRAKTPPPNLSKSSFNRTSFLSSGHENG